MSIDRELRCPFYRGRSADKGRKPYIECEWIGTGDSIQIRHSTDKKAKWHYRTYCCKDYKYCEIYNTVMDVKYNDD